MLFCVECAAFASLRFDDETKKNLIENRVEVPQVEKKETSRKQLQTGRSFIELAYDE